jgi:small subunit ribosomal protein S21
MVQIDLSDTDRIEWALKAFKKQVQKSGILRELRRRRHHVKPSEARQLKEKAARRRHVQRERYRSLLQCKGAPERSFRRAFFFLDIASARS